MSKQLVAPYPSPRNPGVLESTYRPGGRMIGQELDRIFIVQLAYSGASRRQCVMEAVGRYLAVVVLYRLQHASIY